MGILVVSSYLRKGKVGLGFTVKVFLVLFLCKPDLAWAKKDKTSSGGQSRKDSLVLKLRDVSPVIKKPVQIPLSVSLALFQSGALYEKLIKTVKDENSADRTAKIKKLERVLNKTKLKHNRDRVLSKLISLLEAEFVAYWLKNDKITPFVTTITGKLVNYLKDQFLVNTKARQVPLILYKLALFHFLRQNDKQAFSLCQTLMKQYVQSRYTPKAVGLMMAHAHHIGNKRLFERLKWYAGRYKGGVIFDLQLGTFFWDPAPDQAGYKKIKAQLATYQTEGMAKAGGYFIRGNLFAKAAWQVINTKNLTLAEQEFADADDGLMHIFHHTLETGSINLFKKKRYADAAFFYAFLRSRFMSSQLAPGFHYRVISANENRDFGSLYASYHTLMGLFSPLSTWGKTFGPKSNAMMRIQNDLYHFFHSLGQKPITHDQFIYSMKLFLYRFAVTDLVRNQVSESFGVIYKARKSFKEALLYFDLASFYCEKAKACGKRNEARLVRWTIQILEIITKIDVLRPQDLLSEKAVTIDIYRKRLVELYDKLLTKIPKNTLEARQSTLNAGLVHLQAGEVLPSYKRLKNLIYHRQFLPFSRIAAFVLLNRLREQKFWKELYAFSQGCKRGKLMPHNYTDRLLKQDFDLATIQIMLQEDASPGVMSKKLEVFVRKNGNSPQIKMALSLLAGAFQELEKYPEAIKYYQKLALFLVKGSDERRQTLTLIASLYEGLFILPGAAAAFERLFAEFPDSGVARAGIIFAAEIRESERAYALAIKDYQAFVTAFGEDPQTLGYKFRIAENLAKSSVFRRGLAYYQEILASVTGIKQQIQTLKAITKFANKSGQYDEEMQFYKQLIQIDAKEFSTDATLLPKAYYQIGLQLFRKYSRIVNNLEPSKVFAYNKSLDLIKEATVYLEKSSAIGGSGKYATLANLAMYQMNISMYRAGVAGKIPPLDRPPAPGQKVIVKKEPSDQEFVRALSFKNKADSYIRKANSYHRDTLLPFNATIELYHAASTPENSKAIEHFLFPSSRMFMSNTFDFSMIKGED